MCTIFPYEPCDYCKQIPAWQFYVYLYSSSKGVGVLQVSYRYLVPIDYLLHLIYKYHIESTIDAIAQVLYRDLVAVLVVTIV